MQTQTQASAGDLVTALERKLARINETWDREEGDALIDRRPANLDGLNEEIAETEAALDSARDAAKYEADAPKREAAFRKADEELYQTARPMLDRMATLTAELIALIDGAKPVADGLSRTSMMNGFFLPGSRFRNTPTHGALTGRRVIQELRAFAALLKECQR